MKRFRAGQASRAAIAQMRDPLHLTHTHAIVAPAVEADGFGVGASGHALEIAGSASVSSPRVAAADIEREEFEKAPLGRRPCTLNPGGQSASLFQAN